MFIKEVIKPSDVPDKKKYKKTSTLKTTASPTCEDGSIHRKKVKRVTQY